MVFAVLVVLSMPSTSRPGLFQSTSRPFIVDSRMPAYIPHQLPMEKFCPPCRTSRSEFNVHLLYRNSFDQPPVQSGLTLPRIFFDVVGIGRPFTVISLPVAESRCQP